MGNQGSGREAVVPQVQMCCCVVLASDQTGLFSRDSATPQEQIHGQNECEIQDESDWSHWKMYRYCWNTKFGKYVTLRLYHSNSYLVHIVLPICIESDQSVPLFQPDRTEPKTFCSLVKTLTTQLQQVRNYKCLNLKNMLAKVGLMLRHSITSVWCACDMTNLSLQK